MKKRNLFTRRVESSEEAGCSSIAQDLMSTMPVLCDELVYRQVQAMTKETHWTLFCSLGLEY